MTVTDIAQSISSHLFPGFTAAVTYGRTVYLVSGGVQLRQISDDEIKAITPQTRP